MAVQTLARRAARQPFHYESAAASVTNLRGITTLPVPSDFDDDSPPVHEVQNRVEDCHINHGEEQAGIARIGEERREGRVVERGLHRDEGAVPRHLHQRVDEARENARGDEGDDRVDPERDEGAGPGAPAAYVDQPGARGYGNAGHPRRKDDVGAGPQVLADGEGPAPYESHRHPDRAYGKEPVQALREWPRLRDPPPGDDAKHGGGDGRDGRENSFGVPHAATADPHVAVSYTHLRAHETGRNLVCR